VIRKREREREGEGERTRASSRSLALEASRLPPLAPLPPRLLVPLLGRKLAMRSLAVPVGSPVSHRAVLVGVMKSSVVVPYEREREREREREGT